MVGEVGENVVEDEVGEHGRGGSRRTWWREK